MTGSDTMLGTTIPVEIVAATVVDKIPPTTLRIAERTSAKPRDSARVETDVAMAFAAS